MVDETSSTNGEIRNTNEEPEERRTGGRPRDWWKNNIKMCLKDIGPECTKGVNFYSLAVVPKPVLGHLVVEVSISYTDTHNQ
jgi:hypothetical protein